MHACNACLPVLPACLYWVHAFVQMPEELQNHPEVMELLDTNMPAAAACLYCAAYLVVGASDP
jgi:hypothetical protein